MSHARGGRGCEKTAILRWQMNHHSCYRGKGVWNFDFSGWHTFCITPMNIATAQTLFFPSTFVVLNHILSGNLKNIIDKDGGTTTHKFSRLPHVFRRSIKQLETSMRRRLYCWCPHNTTNHLSRGSRWNGKDSFILMDTVVWLICLIY